MDGPTEEDRHGRVYCFAEGSVMSGYVRLMRDIWADPDWLALTSTSKLIYLQLISQPDISRVGVLPQVPGRWASMHPDLSKADITASLGELTEARFIVVDDETEEVWIRTYIVHDELFKFPNGVKSLEVAAQEVISPRLSALIAEQVDPLVRKPKAQPSDEGSDTGSDMGSDMGSANPSDMGSDMGSDTGSAIPLSLVPSPSALVLEPSTLNQEPNTHVGEMTREPLGDAFAEIVNDDDFSHFWSKYPRKTQKAVAAKRWANTKRKDRLAAIEALPAHLEHWLSTRTEPQFIPHAATWLNQRRWEDQLPEHQPQTAGLSRAAQTIQEMMRNATDRRTEDRGLPRGTLSRVD